MFSRQLTGKGVIYLALLALTVSFASTHQSSSGSFDGNSNQSSSNLNNNKQVKHQKGKTSQPKQIKCGAHKLFKGQRVKGRVGKGEFPFLVDISIKDYTNYYNQLPNDVFSSNEQQPNSIVPRIFNCSGAIISRRRILTSIKCIVRNTQGNIKNDSLKLNVTYEIRAGSSKQSAGRLLSTRGSKMSTMEYDLFSNNDHTNTRHGLAIIKLKKRISYSLKHSGGKHNSSTNHLMNRVCFNQDERWPPINEQTGIKDGLYSPSWIHGHKRAKVASLTSGQCLPVDGVSSSQAICAKLKRGTKRYGSLQEGAPLVRFKGKRQWEIVGIYSKRHEPWNECDDDRCNGGRRMEPDVFIPLHADPLRQWLVNEIYQQRLQQ